MPWVYKFTDKALTQLRALDPVVARRIVTTLENKIILHPQPLTLASVLKGPWSGMYRFRVGDYRLICEVRAPGKLIVVIVIGHRREIYS